jgi:hypothetical protein
MFLHIAADPSQVLGKNIDALQAALSSCLEPPSWLLQAAADGRRAELQSLELAGLALKAGLEQHRLQVSWQRCISGF